MRQLRVYMALSIDGYDCGIANHYTAANGQNAEQIYFRPHPAVKSLKSSTLVRFAFNSGMFRGTRISIDNDFIYDFTLTADDEPHRIEFWYQAELWRIEYDTKWYGNN